MKFPSCLLLTLIFGWIPQAAPVPQPAKAMSGDEMIHEYFKSETAKLSGNCLSDIHSLADWNAKKGEYRQQLFEMLGLWPLPEKTDLKPVVTGKLDHPEFTVEKLQFQSLPGLYIAADVYVPKNLTKPAPAVLYVCGHSKIVTNGVSYGNKTAYQEHGEWFARNGYVCLVLDTIQLGEIRNSSRHAPRKNVVVEFARLHSCGSRGVERNSRARLFAIAFRRGWKTARRHRSIRRRRLQLVYCRAG
jgi:hypothetical protein